MGLSRSQRERLLRVPSTVLNAGRRRVRTTFGREQRHRIGAFELTFPPEHDLPYYQRRDPSYDLYAIDVIAAIAARAPATTVVDLGGNVGDTAAAVLSAAPSVRVISVEGSPRFASYWRRNAVLFGDRAELIEGFIGLRSATEMTYTQERGTGGFHTRTTDDSLAVSQWVSLESVLDQVGRDVQLVLKSDIDGFDIHVLAEHWDLVHERSAVVWVEFDPVDTLGDRADIDRLIDQVAQSGRLLDVYDNLGRHMLRTDGGVPAGQALRSLTGWLHEVRRGHLTVPYLDLWLHRAPASM